MATATPSDPPPDYEYAVTHPPDPSTDCAYPLDQSPDYSYPPNQSPPEYSVAASLPSYQQAILAKEKLLAGQEEEEPPRPVRSLRRAERGDCEDEEQDLALLGTDLAFFTAFLTAFLFNWVGFLLLMCFCHTIAARYGALAGFGLSLSKWTLIVKRSTELVRDENAWLWWLVLAFGFLICMRACTQFVQIKRSWRHLSSPARERLFFFY